jgi:hypothetical protein
VASVALGTTARLGWSFIIVQVRACDDRYNISINPDGNLDNW